MLSKHPRKLCVSLLINHLPANNPNFRIEKGRCIQLTSFTAKRSQLSVRSLKSERCKMLLVANAYLPFLALLYIFFFHSHPLSTFSANRLFGSQPVPPLEWRPPLVMAEQKITGKGHSVAFCLG